MEYDLFVSHASEDKEIFVRSLARALKEMGVTVWYDEFTLKVGDSLSKSVDRGLAQSRFGVVILSRAFLSKAWPEYELRGLIAKELEQGKVILPIWLDVKKADILAFSPPLADKMAIVAGSRKIVDVAAEIIDVVRPDIFRRIRRRVAFLNAPRKRMKIETKTIRMGRIRHAKLPAELEKRIRLIRAALFQVDPHSMRHWIDSFRMDSHPSSEVEIWEHMASCLLEIQHIVQLTEEELKHAYKLIIGLSLGQTVDETLAEPGPMSQKARIALLRSWASELPAYDISDDELPADYHIDEDAERSLREDREHFPKDLPEDLLRELADEWKKSHPPSNIKT